MKAKQITLKGFRGATQAAVINFDTSKSLSLIFGENGTGKSTIIDGFDFLCNQTYGSLENFSIGKSAKSFIHSHGNKPSECTVELLSNKGTWKASLSGNNISVLPDTDIPEARILRRPAILRLIELQPKERFNELKNFISVPGTDKLETVIRDSIKESQKLFDEYSRALSQAKDALDVLWAQAEKPGDSSVLWAETRVKADTVEEQNLVDQVDLLIKTISDTEKSMKVLEDSITNEKAAISAESEAISKQKKFESNQKEKDSELFELLQKANNYVKSHSNTGRCPVCETEQKLDILLNRLSNRITAMDDVKVYSSATQQATSQVATKKTLREESEKQFNKQLNAFLKLINSSSSEIIPLLGLINELMQTGLSFETFSSWHRDYISSYKLNLTNKKEALQKNISLKATIQAHLNIVKEKEELARTKQNTVSELTAILEIVEKERKEYIEGILKKISSEVASLYSSLHPDEKIGNARFYLKPNQIGSLEFDASFQDKDEIPPQAYYSESHLDTLGICVFIALSKHYKTDNTILILDDVLTSVDAQHMDRFMKMLHEQSKIFTQIIVTTHYRPWRDRYRWLKGPSSNIDIIELGPWTLTNGIITNQFQFAIDELKSIASKTTFDRQHTASLAGIVLESLLDFITIQYSCSLPRNPKNEYTLGDLVNGIDGKFAKLLKIITSKGEFELKPLLEKTTSEQWIRNCVGCHFNSLGSEVTDIDVKSFINNVIEISDLIICTDCKTLTRKNKSGSYLECNCGLHQMHPLTQPGMMYRSMDDDN